MSGKTAPTLQKSPITLFLPSACMSYVKSSNICSKGTFHGFVKTTLEVSDALLDSIDMECNHYHLMEIRRQEAVSDMQFSFKDKVFPFSCSMSDEGSVVLHTISQALQQHKFLYFPEEIMIEGHNDNLSLESKGFSKTDCIPVVLSGVTHTIKPEIVLKKDKGVTYYDVTLRNKADIQNFNSAITRNDLFSVMHLIVRIELKDDNSATSKITNIFSSFSGVFLPYLEVITLVYLNWDVNDDWIDCFFAESFVSLSDIVVYVPCSPVPLSGNLPKVPNNMASTRTGNYFDFESSSTSTSSTSSYDTTDDLSSPTHHENQENAVAAPQEPQEEELTFQTLTINNGIVYNIRVVNMESKNATVIYWKRQSGTRSFVVKPDSKSVAILVEYNDSSYCIPINKADYEYPLVCHVLRGLAMYGIVTKSSAISLSLQNGNAISKKATPSSLREKAIICKISDESSSANPSVLTIDIKKHSLSWGKNMLFTSTINNTILSLVGK